MAAIQINTNSLPQLTDLVTYTFQEALEPLNQTMRRSGFVIEEPMALHTGEFKNFTENIDRNQYAGVRPEGGVAPESKVQFGYQKIAQIYTLADQISITRIMRDAGKDQDIIRRLVNLAQMIPNTIDLDLAHNLTFAWDSSYIRTAGYTTTTVDVTVGDGFPLIYPAHTLTGSPTTYSNQIPGNPSFSKGALEAAENLFVTQTFDNFGIKMLMDPDCIITTDDPNTINQVRELMFATANVDSSNAGTFNVYHDKYTHVIVSRLATDGSGAIDTSKKGYWFLASKRDSQFKLSVLAEPYLKTPMDGNNGEEFSSENWNYLTGAELLMANVTGKWIKGSKGDGSL